MTFLLQKPSQILLINDHVIDCTSKLQQIQHICGVNIMEHLRQKADLFPVHFVS